MLGIGDYGTFCAAILLFLALPGPGTVIFLAMAATIAVITVAYGLMLCAFANAVSARVRAHQTLGRALERLAGVFLVGFGIRMGAQ